MAELADARDLKSLALRREGSSPSASTTFQMAIYNGKNILGRRLRMFRRDPNCFWCGVRTVLDAEGQPHHATIDHLYSKMHPLRPVKYSSGHDRTAVLHVLACMECNQARGKADTKGYVFVPKLKERRGMAMNCSAVIGRTEYIEPLAPPTPRKPNLKRPTHRPTKRAFMDETIRGFGWTDERKDLRPCSWEEYVTHKPAFVGPSFYRPVKPKREAICTFGEILQWHGQSL